MQSWVRDIAFGDGRLPPEATEETLGTVIREVLANPESVSTMVCNRLLVGQAISANRFNGLGDRLAGVVAALTCYHHPFAHRHSVALSSVPLSSQSRCSA